jgi:hypothetical protein
MLVAVNAAVGLASPVMRPSMTFSLVLATAFAAACGGSSSSMNHIDGSGSGSGVKDSKPLDGPLYDFGCGGNTACDTTKVCCTTPGPMTSFACADPASCPAGDKIACDGPDECGGSTPICCGVDVADGTGSFPMCGIASIGTSCTNAAQCKTHLPTSCSDTTKVQICHVSSECTDPTNNMCCTFSSNGAMLTFCIDSTTASLGGATCH